MLKKQILESTKPIDKQFMQIQTFLNIEQHTKGGKNTLQDAIKGHGHLVVGQAVQQSTDNCMRQVGDSLNMQETKLVTKLDELRRDVNRVVNMDKDIVDLQTTLKALSNELHLRPTLDDIQE